MSADAARAWVVRLASGTLTDDEMAAFKQWLSVDPSHQAHFDRERTLWRAIEPLQPEFAAPRRIGVKPSLQWAGAAMAACLLIVVLIADPFTHLRADHVTSVGQVSTVTLPDGSVAVLNTDTALAVHFDDSERGVEVLKGEAWFEVVKNAERPFRVHAGHGVAEAVGTAFSVNDERDHVTVSVTEGVVAVSADNSESVRVTPGRVVTYSAALGIGPVDSFDASDELAWREGRVVIDDVPLSTAIAQLDRYRRGRILLLADAGVRRVSGIFSVDKIDQGLEGLALTHGLTLTRVTPYLLLLR